MAATGRAVARSTSGALMHLSITMDGKPVDIRFERPSEWDGDVLVFADTVPTSSGEMTIVFRYELQEGGRRLRAAKRLRAPDREQDSVWVFDRAGQPLFNLRGSVTGSLADLHATSNIGINQLLDTMSTWHLSRLISFANTVFRLRRRD